MEIKIIANCVQSTTTPSTTSTTSTTASTIETDYKLPEAGGLNGCQDLLLLESGDHENKVYIMNEESTNEKGRNYNRRFCDNAGSGNQQAGWTVIFIFVVVVLYN